MLGVSFMLNELIELSSGFQSSVNISYDLKNDEKIQNFIPTTSSLELISNILNLIYYLGYRYCQIRLKTFHLLLILVT